MCDLQLYRFADATTLELLDRLDSNQELDLKACFWVGSASRRDPVQLERFLSLAREGKVLELKKYFAIDEDPIYGVLVRDRSVSSKYNIFVIETRPALADPKCVFADRLPGDFSVQPRPETDIPLAFIARPKVELWRAFFELFVPKRILKIFSFRKSS